MKRNTIALVGRPNTGKSTIFNKLVGKKISIIDDMPGVTRDRIYSLCTFKDYTFNLIDTGGIEISDASFNDEIKVQAEIAIDEADIIFFVVDGKLGLNSDDYVVRDMLLKSKKTVYVLINKCDTREFKNNMYDFYALGFDNYYNVSGEQNIGFYDLLEDVTRTFNKDEIIEEDDVLKFAIIGRPNVGKSSLVNAILNEERLVVSDIAGTTRDAVDSEFVYHGTRMSVIDTAGMRKKGKIYENIEKYSLLRSLKAIDRARVCVIVINASEGIIEHDKHIAGYAIEAGKGVVIVVNKWDMIDDKDEAIKKFTKDIRANFQFMPYSNIVFLSALTKKRIHTLIPEVVKAYENNRKEIKTSLVNDVVEEAYNLNPPPSYKGKRLKIYFTHQVSTSPPTFDIEVNSKGLVHFSYARYLENKIRESFDFTGTPIVINFKNKGEKEL